MRLPGFIDSHLHFLGLGYTLENVDLNMEKSIDSVIKKLTKHTDKPIIIGRGWNQTNFIEKRMITKNDLNKVSNHIPIVLIRVCGHVLVANDSMLKLADVNRLTNQIEGGFFDYQSGIFTENALSLIYDHMPKPSQSDLERYIINANHLLLSNGITHVASDDFSTLSIPYETIINVFNKLYHEQKIQVRLTEQVNLQLDELKDFINKGYVNKRFNESYQMGPLKILADGSLGGKTAALMDEYTDDTGNIGILTYTDEELFELVHLANTNGMDVVIHAIGDRAVTQALNALVKSIQLTKRYHHHHAIIHAQLANKSHIKLMKAYNIGAIVQPIFLNSDISIIRDRIGKRASESYLFKSMFKENIRVGFSTDSPIEPVNPFKNIFTAIKRKSIKDPTLNSFLIEEAFNLEESLRCYTENNLNFVSKKAMNTSDYIIIDKILTEDNLLEIQVLETYVNNSLVYKKETV